MTEQTQNHLKEMTLLDHLEELRWRILRSLIYCLIGFGVAWYIRHDIVAVLQFPLQEPLAQQSGKLVALALTDVFMLHLKACFLVGIMIAFPLIALEAWGFVAPGLYKHEKLYFVLFLSSSQILFYSGVLFSYFYVLPFAFQFFVEYSTQGIGSFLSADIPELTFDLHNYIVATAKFALSFGLIFQMPLAIVVLVASGLVSREFFAKYRKYMVLVILIISATLTPPDPITLILMSVPLYLLYEIGLIITFFMGKKEA